MHIKHTDGHFEHVPYFSLPANDLTEVIAPSCYSCFDYPNALADLVRPLPIKRRGVQAHPSECLSFQVILACIAGILYLTLLKWCCKTKGVFISSQSHAVCIACAACILCLAQAWCLHMGG